MKKETFQIIGIIMMIMGWTLNLMGKQLECSIYLLLTGLCIFEIGRN